MAIGTIRVVTDKLIFFRNAGEKTTMLGLSLQHDKHITALAALGLSKRLPHVRMAFPVKLLCLALHGDC